MIKTGILLPRSTLFPAMGFDLLHGLKTSLQQRGVRESFQLLTDNIGFGADQKEIYSKAERLLLQEDADIVIVVADTAVEELLSPLFTAYNKLLIVVHFGANFPESWTPAPTTWVHSLNFCLHTRLTGKLAAAQEDKQAVYTASFYDAGYRQCYAFLNSHQQNGGIACYTHVTDFRPDFFTLQPADDFLAANPVQNMICLYAADLAALFYEKAAPLQEKYKLNLFVSPMMLDASVRDYAGDKTLAVNATGYTPWLPSLDNEENSLFCSGFEKAANKKANIMGLLGWETGMLLDLFAKQFEQKNQWSEVIISAGDSRLPSPRGWLQLDKTTQHSVGPSWLATATGNFEVMAAGETMDTLDEWRSFTKETLSADDTSGWKNTYLCI